ncbi:MAG: orotidine 5'-phosphate decarboxylase / HUMPS family protein [Desulfurococcaceae archaeon]|nr:orotidine 5'-phosphate decarboxylase [Sulfolobales archaeon]MDW8169981.1 orotidine 5'-phosphate decarboxylase / HUMPS family protein [Desulfurococcaceae archaeon]
MNTIKRPALQVALDLIDLTEALKIALELSLNLPREHLIIEAGTPLIKSWGTLAVELLKKITNAIVFADTKTIDVGKLEASMFFDKGADIVSVLSTADDSTVKSMIDEARARGKYVAADLITSKDPLMDSKRLIELGTSIIVYHIGIDVQLSRGITARDLIKEIEEVRKLSLSPYLAVAGGLKPGTVKPLVASGVDIVIVGGAITKSKDPLSVAKELMKELEVL